MLNAIINFLKEMFGNAAWLPYSLVALLAAWALHHFYTERRDEYAEELKEGGAGKERLKRDLQNPGDRRTTYLRVLGAGLGWASRHFGPIEPFDAAAAPWRARLFARNPWPVASYDLSLTLALIYPIAGVLLVWLLSGANTSGIAALLPEQASAWQRSLAMLALGGEIGFFYAWVRSDGCKRWLFYALGLAFAGAVAGFILWAALTMRPRAEAGSWRGGFNAGFWLSFIALCGFAAWHSRSLPANSNAILWPVAVFFVVLPLVNALYDWLSIGITRGLLTLTAVNRR